MLSLDSLICFCSPVGNTIGATVAVGAGVGNTCVGAEVVLCFIRELPLLPRRDWGAATVGLLLSGFMLEASD